ncbi:hypothetical protein PGN44_15845 [Klebsiella aerogenes]
MTDLTRLLASLKRRSAHAKEFGHDVLFVKLEDIDALVEALEKAQQLETQAAEMAIQISKRLAEAYKCVTELESRTVTVKLPKLKMLEDYLAGVAVEERKEILLGVRMEFHRLLNDAGIKTEVA